MKGLGQLRTQSSSRLYHVLNRSHDSEVYFFLEPGDYFQFLVSLSMVDSRNQLVIDLINLSTFF